MVTLARLVRACVARLGRYLPRELTSPKQLVTEARLLCRAAVAREYHLYEHFPPQERASILNSLSTSKESFMALQKCYIHHSTVKVARKFVARYDTGASFQQA